MIIEAILKINPNAKVVVRGSDLNTCEIEWLNGTSPIPKEQILAILPQVELDMALNKLRAKRNKLLIDSDYVVLADSPITDKANWITYRQALRDITNGLTTIEQVNNITWPIKP
jgi:hypothetical protein